MMWRFIFDKRPRKKVPDGAATNRPLFDAQKSQSEGN
jgi:hypothetical protein